MRPLIASKQDICGCLIRMSGLKCQCIHIQDLYARMLIFQNEMRCQQSMQSPCPHVAEPSGPQELREKGSVTCTEFNAASGRPTTATAACTRKRTTDGLINDGHDVATFAG